MLPSPIEVTRAALQATADHFRHSLGVYTKLVLVGVAIEGIEFAVEVAAWIVRKLKRRVELADLKKLNDVFPASDIPQKQNKEFILPTWVKFVAFVGLVFVVVGVRGELIFEDKLQMANNDIQTFDEKLLNDAAQSAKDANDEADAAKKVSAEAKSDAAEAGKDIVVVRKSVGNIARQANDLGSELSATKVGVEVVDAKRVELEKSLENMAVCDAPRVLWSWSVGKKTSIDPLKALGKHQVTIQFMPDAEARRAALSIAGTLQQAG
jgi:hypothetical protein